MNKSFMNLARHDGMALSVRDALSAIPTDRTVMPVAESPEFEGCKRFVAEGRVPPGLQTAAEKAVEAVSGETMPPKAQPIDYLSINKRFCG